MRERIFIISYLGKRGHALIFTFIFGCLFQISYGQLGDIGGRIRDTAFDRDCPYSIIAVLAPDSTLLQFARSHKDGSFYFRGLPNGKIYLLITHSGYVDLWQPFTVYPNILNEIGTVIMTPRADTLAAVIVTPKGPSMYIRGDTLEYNTANMKVKVNATVEELLALLPGAKVDPQGNITVNGEKVKRLLVDGEDFFSTDPTVFTRNFNADMIAKVQVLDKKSSRAEFTGLDDGQRTKTINLTLKEDSKKGYFAKGEAGGDPQGYYSSNALVGSFKGSRQLAVLGLAANTGVTGFSGSMGGMGSDLNFTGGSYDMLGGSAGTGIPTVISGGIHYADRWNGDESHLDGNYACGYLATRPISNLLTEQILPDSIYIQKQQSNSINFQSQEAINADYDFMPDSLSAFQFSIGGAKVGEQNELSSIGISSFNDTMVNNSTNSTHSLVQNRNFRGNILWRIRRRKNKESIFSIVGGVANQDNTTAGYLYSTDKFYYPSGVFMNSDTIDQRKLIHGSSLFLNSGINYISPLLRDVVLASGYELTFSRSQSILSTFDKGDGKYQVYIDSLSSHYQNDVLTEKMAMNLQGRGDLFSYTIGSDIMYLFYTQRDLLKDTILYYRYFNITPRASARYRISNSGNFTFDYISRTQQPTIYQLQPIQNNNDPLHITIGNPSLQPSFYQDFALAYHNIKPFIINMGLNFDLASNGISTRTYTDSLGRQVSQALNTNGSKSIMLYFAIVKRLARLSLDFDANTYFTYSQSVNYVNSILSFNGNYGARGNVTISRSVPDRYNFALDLNFAYVTARSSINPEVVTQYWSQSHSAQIGFFPVRALEFTSICYYTWKQKTSAFDTNIQTILWNAAIVKNLFNNLLTIKWQLNDILGQNSGISRTIFANQVSQSMSNLIGRYWMLTATYRFINHSKPK